MARSTPYIHDISEDVLTVHVANWLRIALPEGCGVPWTHFPAGEMRKRSVGPKLKRMGMMPGWPDFIFLWRGNFIGIEIKRPKTPSQDGGTQSKTQKLRQAEIEGQDGYYHLAESVAEVGGILRAHGLPLKARVAA